MQKKSAWTTPQMSVHGNVEDITKQIPAQGSGFVKLEGKGDDTLVQQMGTFSCCC